MKRRKINNKVILLLSVFLLFMLCVGAVSASPDADSIDDSGDLAVLKTVRDDAALSDAVDEDMVSSGEAADTLSVNNDSEVLGSTGTYSGLAREIATGRNVVLLQHSLYTYDSGDTITISGANRVIDGNGAVIDMAGSNIRAFYVDGSGVTIKNLTIKNANYDGYGGAVYMHNSGSVVNCSFVNCSATSGGAVYMSGSGSVVNCSFVNCSARGGGAVYMHNSGSVVNCSFVNCSATSGGGAVLMYRSGSVVNCSFVNCSANGNGGAVSMSSGSVVNCSFVNCSASYRGGAVYFSGNGTVTNCNFINNTAGSGGAVYFYGNGTVTNCNFTNNYGSQGGALYMRESGSVVSKCSFVNSSVDVGGAVSMQESGSVVNCSFVNCSATRYGGGAVYMDSGSVVNCSFVNNSGNYRNIYIYSGSFTLEDNKFLDTIIILYNYEFEYGSDFTVNGTLDAGVNVAIDGLTFKLNDTAVHTYTLYVGLDQQFSFTVGGTDLAPGNYNITATTDANNNEYTLTGSSIFTVKEQLGDFNIIQNLINAARENSVVDLTRNYTFTVGKDKNLVGGIVVDKAGLTIDGHGHSIDGLGLARIFQVIVDDVTLRNITLVNSIAATLIWYHYDAGAVYFSGSGSVANCNFTNNKLYDSYSTGIAVYMGSGSVTNCNFTNNTARVGNGAAVSLSGSGSVENCNFINNGGRLYGAVLMSGSGSVTNCNFTNNYGAHLGAVYIGSGSVENCNFINNTAGRSYGAVYFYGNGTVTNCNFTNNSGGAVYFYGNGTVTNCNFTNNTAVSGGAVYIGSGSGTVTNCNFINNTAGSGGAVYFYSNGTVTNCNFTNNSGDAVFLNGFGSVTNCNFINNTANDYMGPGAMYMGSGSVTNCNFINNVANDFSSGGGAVYFYGNGAVTNCNFTNNKAVGYHSSDGGAIYFYGNGAVTNCNFTNNYADHHGAAIFAKDSVLIQNSVFNNNSAGTSGAVVLGENLLNANIINCSFFGNSAPTEDGGAITAEGGSSNVVISDCLFDRNTAKNKAGAIWMGSVDSIIKNCTFTDNAASDGGAIYWEYSASGFVENCSFENNSAEGNGGAVYMSSGSVVNCSFVNCSARSGSGGAVYIVEGSVVNCSFVDCSAIYGGAVYMVNYGSVVSNCSFVNCSAIYGGAVGLGSGSVVSNCSFVNCSANGGYGGGAVYMRYSGSVVSNCSFVDCSASGSGGAVYMRSVSGSVSGFVVSNCSFMNNSGNYRNIYIHRGSFTLEDNKFLDTTITLNNKNFNYGSDFTVSGTVDAGVNVAIGDLTFKLNDTVHTYTSDVGTDNKFSFVVDGTELAAGTYNITTSTDANNNEYTLTGSQIFTVNKAALPFTVGAVDTVTYPDDVSVTITAGVAGTFTVTIGTMSSDSISIAAGETKTVKVSGVSAGADQTVNVTGSPVDTVNYTAKTDSSRTVTVNQAGSGVNIVDVDDGVYNTPVVVTFNNLVNASGIADNVKIYDEVTKAEITGLDINVNNNDQTITVSGLAAGDYIINVTTVPENSNYHSDVGSGKIHVDKALLDMVVEIESSQVTYPDDVVVFISAPLAGDYKVSIGDKETTVHLTLNQYGRVVVSGLNANDNVYDVVVVGTPDDLTNYDVMTNNSLSVKVNKAKLPMSVSVVSVIYPDDVIVTVNTPVSGTYNVTIGDKKNSVYVDVIGSVDFVISGLAARDNYDVVVVGTPDDLTNYDVMNNNTYVNVTRATLDMPVSVISPVTYPDDVVVNINAPVAGTYAIEINGKKNSTYVAVAGLISLSISGLAACDNYVVDVVGTPDDNVNYTSMSNSTTVTVDKATLSMQIDVVSPVFYPGDVVVNVTAPVDGNYSVTIDGVMKWALISKDQTESFTFANLLVRDQPYEISVEGTPDDDTNYTGMLDDTHTVRIVDKEWNPLPISVISPVTYPDVVVVTVSAPVDGYYNVTINGIVNGTHISAGDSKDIVISGLDANSDEYLVTVVGTPDSPQYAVLVNTTSVKVNQAGSIVNVIDVVDAVYGNTVVVSFTIPEDGNASGIAADVKIYNATNNVEITGLDINVNNAAKTISIDGLAAGDYIVNVTTAPINGNYASSVCSGSIHINKADLILPVSVISPVVYPGDVVVTVNAPVAGTYTVIVGSKMNSIHVDAGGPVDIHISGLDAKDSYGISVVGYADDSSYNPMANDTLTVKVYQAGSSVNIVDVLDGVYNAPVVVTFNNLVNASGIENVKIYNATDKSEIAGLTIDVDNIAGTITVTGLSNGNYIINATTIPENDNYYSVVASGSIHVGKAIMVMPVSAPSQVIYPEDVVVTVSAPVDGTYTVTINGISNSSYIAAGESVGIVIRGLDARDAAYDISVIGVPIDSSYEGMVNNTLSVNVIKLGDFNYIQYLINKAGENGVIELDRDYAFTPGLDDNMTEGIVINKKGLTINGNGYAIDGLGRARLFQVLASDVTLNDMDFVKGFAVNGGAIYWRGENGVVSESYFMGNNATAGGAIYWQGDAGYIKDSVFINNKANSDSLSAVQDNDLIFTFKGNENYINAIYTSRYDINFDNVTYWAGSVVNSDDVYPNKQSEEVGIYITVEIYDALNNMIHNETYVTDEFGKVSYDYSQLTPGNYIYKAYHEDDSYYSYIETNGGFSVNKYDIIVLGNQTVYVIKDASVTLQAIIDYKGTIDFTSVGLEFVLPNGTKVQASNVNNVWVADYVFTEIGNYTITAVTHGMDNYSYNTTFTGQVIVSDPILGDFQKLQKLIDDANDGDVIDLGQDYIYTIGLDDAIVDGVIVNKNNLIIDGHGYTIDALEKSRIFNVVGQGVIIRNITLVNGKTEDEGGAILWSGDDGNVSDSSFEANWANNGGAISWYGQNGAVSDCTFVDNIALISGGAILWSGDDGSVFGCSFEGSDAAAGGAIDWSGADGSVCDCSFVDNTVSDAGGAVEWLGHNGILSDCIFIDNSAIWEGGAICWHGWDGTVSGCSFDSNFANNYGGAVYWSDWADTGTLWNCSFINNNATLDGGAVYWYGYDGTLYNCSFTDNIAIWDGGAVYWGGSLGTVYDCYFDSNDAEDGGAIEWSGDEAKIYDCSFVDNTASWTGGALHWASYNGVLSNCSFEYNTATLAGGAIYCVIDSGMVSNSTFNNNDGADYRNIYLKVEGMEIIENKFLDTTITLDEADYVYGDDLIVSGVIDAGVNYEIDSLKLILNDTLGSEFTSNVGIDRRFSFTVAGGILAAGTYNVAATNDLYDNEYALTSCETFVVNKAGSSVIVIDVTDGVYSYPVDVSFTIPSNGNATGVETTGVRVYNATNNEEITGLTIVVNNNDRIIKIINLAAGDYIVNVTTAPINGNYASSVCSGKVHVDKANLTLSARVTSPVTYPSDVVVTVMAPIAGTYTVTINGISNSVHIDAGGFLDIGISGLIPSDDAYPISVVGVPDDSSNYENMACDDLTVKVDSKKIDPDVNVIAEYIGDGNVNVAVDVPSDFTGDIAVIVGDTEYPVVGGSTVVPGVPGDEIIVKLTDDPIYKDKNVSVTVPKADLEDVNVTVSDNGDGTFNITVDVPDDFTGDITVVVNGTEYPVDNGTVTVPVVPGGDIIVEFDNDPIYNDKNISVVVKKDLVDVNVTAEYIGDGKVNVAVDVPDDFTGKVTAEVNGVVYPVVGGSTVVLAVPCDEIIVEFSDDPIYNDKNVSVVVPKVDLVDVDVSAVDNGDGTFNISVDVPDDFSGDITVIIGDVEYPVSEGTSVVPVDVAGEEIIVEFGNDPIYADMNVSVVVQKELDDVNVSAVDNGDGTFNITVDVPDDFTGDITIIVDGVEYPVDNGTATVPVNPGEEIIIKFDDDPIYDDKEITYDVPKKDLSDDDINVTVTDNGDGTMDVSVDVPDDFNGDITIIVDGVEYPVDNGTVTVPITPGSDFIVEFSDDPIYNDKNVTVVVAKKDLVDVNVTVSDNGDGTFTIGVDVPDDFTGDVAVNVEGVEYPVSDGTAVIPAVVGEEIIVEFSDDPIYNDKTIPIVIKKELPDGDVNVTFIDNGNGTMNVTVDVPEDFTGNITIIVNGTEYPVTNGTAVIPVNPGDEIIVDFGDDPIYANKNITVVVKPKLVNGTVVIENKKRAVGSPYDAVANFTDEYGKPLVNTRVEFIVDGVTYYAVTDENGTAYLGSQLPLVNDTETQYSVTAVNPRTGENMTAVSTIVPRFIVCSGDLSADYLENPSYVVQVIGDDANPVGAGEIVRFVFAGFYYDIPTNETGHAVRPIGLAPGMYAVYATYKGQRTEQTVFMVYQTLKAYSGTIVKTAKSYTLKATLIHTNGTPLVGKEVTLQLNNKKYVVKTNSKGVASYTIKSSVIKKLKAGTVYNLTARYVNDLTKGKSVGKIVVVSHAISAKKTTVVKKSAKSASVKITLNDGSVLKNKKLSIKFNGKIYSAKTNNKGIAYFKLNSNVLKTLGKGKTYSYVITYSYDKLTRYINVK